MADCILFEKENNFCMAFVLAVGWPIQESAHGVHLEYAFYLFYIYIYIYIYLQVHKCINEVL